MLPRASTTNAAHREVDRPPQEELPSSSAAKGASWRLQLCRNYFSPKRGAILYRHGALLLGLNAHFSSSIYCLFSAETTTPGDGGICVPPKQADYTLKLYTLLPRATCVFVRDPYLQGDTSLAELMFKFKALFIIFNGTRKIFFLVGAWPSVARGGQIAPASTPSVSLARLCTSSSHMPPSAA